MAIVTRDVIVQLIEESRWTQRAKSLEQLATRFIEGGLGTAEWHTITDAFRVALYDGEPLVRRVLAETVKFAADLPRDILLSLARDIAAVATPVLEHSPALHENDVLPIVQRASPAHRFAIAGRRRVSERVAAVLCRPREGAVIHRLLANEGALIGEATLHELLDAFPDQPDMAEAIGGRRLLPVSVGARLLGGAELRGTAGASGPRLIWDRTGSLG
jgi:uncharacterized protein (DUF2336 family)